MSTTMYDSTNPFDIPAAAPMVAGYVNGIYAWSAAGWARFAGKVQWRISITAAANAGNVLDVETGDATPAQAPGWVVMRRLAGVDPIIYVQASTWRAVQLVFIASGIPQPHWWIANYDGNSAIPAGAIAKQYANQAIIPGHPHYDLSSVDEQFGGGGGTIPQEDELQFVSPFHPLKASLTAFADGSYYHEPFGNLPAAGGVTKGAVYAVDGWRWSSSPVQSSNLGNGQPGPDAVFWHAVNGGWVPDAVLTTTGVAGAPSPAFPATEPVEALFDAASGRYIPLGASGPIGLVPHTHALPQNTLPTITVPAATSGPANKT